MILKQVSPTLSLQNISNSTVSIVIWLGEECVTSRNLLGLGRRRFDILWGRRPTRTIDHFSILGSFSELLQFLYDFLELGFFVSWQLHKFVHNESREDSQNWLFLESENINYQATQNLKLNEM